jgi:hypothetical protein
MFFFEKKNQKTFLITHLAQPTEHVLDSIKRLS